MLFCCTSTLIGVVLTRHPVVVGLSTIAIWIGLAIVFQRFHIGLRKWALVLWLVYGLLALVSLTIGSEMWGVATFGTTIGILLLRTPNWITRHGRKSYATTLQFKKLTTIDDVLAIAKGYQLIVVDHRIDQRRHYELTLRYESYPISHHLFMRAITTLPAIKRIASRG